MDNYEYLTSLVHELRKLSKEQGWLEFKHNNSNKEDIGSYLSALSNSAALLGKSTGYVVWGVDDSTHDIIGTTFNPFTQKVGNEELESWLLQRLEPKLNFRFRKFEIDNKTVVILEIPAASKHPTVFQNEKLIRIGSYRKKLKDFPEKERELWRILDKTPFESLHAQDRLQGSLVLERLDYPSYFELLKQPVPDGHQAILSVLEQDELINKNDAGEYNITNLGAILFAKDLADFPSLKRKSIRVIQYEGDNKIKTIREHVGSKGYASGFKGLIDFIMTLIPTEERLDSPIRKTVSMFPELAIRELVANALIHQDFFATGSAVMVELFASRIEISNPGEPLVSIERFLDTPPKSRNEKLASLMRRLGICEERGSGIDKVVFEIELNQLPAPIFEAPTDFTRSILFSHRKLKNLTKQDRLRACYFHACLKYIERDYMTNASLRKRFGIATKNVAMASRIINDAIQAGLICIYDETVGAKARKYIPVWARS
nr:RNA-binding domain-containing protein [uncultured Desulfobacter sp.]